MNNQIIEVYNIGKRYRLGQTHGKAPGNKFYSYKSLRDVLTENVTKFTKLIISSRGQERKKLNSNNNSIWALKDISFKVKSKEMVGIIGRNGAGKSTLLKIISQITEPTEGQARLRGRVASLLEVGTGFHPELTGRENIYLNSAILGMSRAEIKEKFDTIVSFAGVEKFIDTPVKRFSTGMYVRLAFSVAAHLDVEILLIDEVLAVGDYEFQKKCLNKMEDIAKGGRTILFVSHNLSAIKRFCRRTILIDSGKIVADGPTEDVIKLYLDSGMQKQGEREWSESGGRPGNDTVKLHAIRVKNSKGNAGYDFNIQEPICLEMEYSALTENSVLEDIFLLYDEAGQLLFATVNDSEKQSQCRRRGKGLYKTQCRLPANLLNEGMIIVTAGVFTFPSICHFLEKNAVSFRVYDPGHGGARGSILRPWFGGAVRPLLEWNVECMQTNKL